MTSPFCIMILSLLVTKCGKVSAQSCYTSSSDCSGGSGSGSTTADQAVDQALTTYESCCGPARNDNTVRRSFETHNGACHECINDTVPDSSMSGSGSGSGSGFIPFPSPTQTPDTAGDCASQNIFNFSQTDTLNVGNRDTACLACLFNGMSPEAGTTWLAIVNGQLINNTDLFEVNPNGTIIIRRPPGFNGVAMFTCQRNGVQFTITIIVPAVNTTSTPPIQATGSGSDSGGSGSGDGMVCPPLNPGMITRRGSCVLRGLSGGCCNFSQGLTCTGACGVRSGICFCDQACHRFRDCCSDVLEIDCFPGNIFLPTPSPTPSQTPACPAQLSTGSGSGSGSAMQTARGSGGSGSGSGLQERCSCGDVRLVGGSTAMEGRVEVCLDGVYGTVCDDLWDKQDARVVCRQLGLPFQNAESRSSAFFGRGTGQILLDDVSCSGNEQRLIDCSSITNHNCVHAEDAGVVCQEPTYQFTEADYNANEATGMPIMVTVRQTVRSVQDIHLLLVPLTYDQYIARAAEDPSLAGIDVYHVTRPDAAEHNVTQDFNSTVQTMFFPANSATGAEQSVSFPIYDDTIDEEPEGFIIVLYLDTNLTSIEVAFTPNLRTTLGRINDNDLFYFGFFMSEVTYNEARDEGRQNITYSPSPGNETERSFNFSLNLTPLQGNFEFGANGDISLESGTSFTYFPNVPAEDRVVTLNVTRDNIVEGQEIGRLQIAQSTSFAGFEPYFQNLRIAINDSNSAVFNLSAPLVVNEQDLRFNATISLLEPSGGTSFPIEIIIMENNITATPSTDIERQAPFSFIFQGTVQRTCCVEQVSYAVKDDNIAEPNETMTISITSTSNLTIEFDTQNINVTIVDNDVARIGFVQCPGVVDSVQEDERFAKLLVALLDSNITLGGEVIVQFSTRNASATAGLDYNSTVTNLTFSSIVRHIVVRVPILQDMSLEGTEQFHASLSLVESNGINVDMSIGNQAIVSIIDDDVAVIGFTQNSVNVSEAADTSALLILKIMSGVFDPDAWAEVEFTTSDLPSSNTSAVSPDDYNSTTKLFNFTSSNTEFHISVLIINDNLIELTEMFQANLRVVSKHGVEIILQPGQAIVNISSEDATAECFTTSVDCSGATDRMQNMTFETCCQAVLDNRTIQRSYRSDGSCFGCIVIGFEKANYSLNESNTPQMLQLKLLSSPRSRRYQRPRLRLKTIPGTASVNEFSLASSDILLRNPVAGIDIPVFITNDGIAGERPETFTITHQPPVVSSRADPMFLFRETTITIIDINKPTYHFDQDYYDESESSDSAIIVSVRQIVPSVRDIHLLLVPLTYEQYIARAASDSTLADIDEYHRNRPDAAEHGVRQDFNSTVQTMFFAANSATGTEQSVSFQIYDDTIDEDPEGFIIVLYRDNNLTSIEVAFTPNRRTTLGRINDNDLFFFGFVLNEVTYDEALDEGQQKLMYSPAPGNTTEKSFDFFLMLSSQEQSFVFGADGDITFGTKGFSPIFRFRADNVPEDCTVNFTINRDNFIECQEIGEAVISPSVNFFFSEPIFQSVRIIINDSTVAVFNLSAPATVNEHDGGFSTMITMIAPSGGSAFPIRIDLGITATPNADYRRRQFTFQGTQRPVRVANYSITNDKVAGPDEILTISIAQGVANKSIPVKFAVQQVNITIIDDDVARIGFENITFSVEEGAGFAELRVALLGDVTLGGRVTVRFHTSDLSSVAGLDYNKTVKDLIFNSSVQRMVVQVPILPDEFSEETEQFRANLSLVESNGINVTLSPEQATVSINDDKEVASTDTSTGQSIIDIDNVFAEVASTDTSTEVASTDTSTEVASTDTSTEVASTDTSTVVASTDASTVITSSESSTNTAIIALSVFASAFGAIVLALFLCMLLLYCRKYFKTNKSNELNENIIELKNMQLNQPTLKVSPELLPSLSKMLILKWQVRLLDIIGQGEFGIVYKAHLLRSKQGNDFTIVAAKTLRGNFDTDAVEQLVKESIQMKNFQHRNVMGMLGVCLDAGPAPYLVLPFMTNGDLLSYLKKSREDVVLSDEADENTVMVVQTKLLLMCLQIANGMQYLAGNNIVHRDLAARNCMIDECWIIKVADFGLTKSVYEKRYFREDKDEFVKLPIKWMAIESIDDGIFTEKTDVWSFGVTCWEIFSGGRMPFGGVHPTTLARMLRNGERMDAPENSACSSEVFATVMQQCWERDPDRRPTFSQLTVAIDSIATAMTGYMELSVFSAESDENNNNNDS